MLVGQTAFELRMQLLLQSIKGLTKRTALQRALVQLKLNIASAAIVFNEHCFLPKRKERKMSNLNYYYLNCLPPWR